MSKVKSYVSPYLSIPDQEGAGFCVSCALSTVVEIMLMNERQTENVPELSRLFLQAECKDSDGMPDDQGTFPSIALSKLKGIGICEESMYPFEVTDEVRKLKFPERTKDMFNNAKNYRIKDWSTTRSVDSIKQHILKYGAVAMEEKFHQTKYHKNVLVEIGKKSSGNHLTALVGFDDDFEYMGFKGAFLRIDGNTPQVKYGYGVDIIPYHWFTHTWFTQADLLIPERTSTFLADKYSGTRIVPYYDEIDLQVGSLLMMVNGVEHKLDIAPILKHDTTLVPIRVCREAFRKVDVDWDNTNKTAIVHNYSETFYFKIGRKEVLNASSEVVYTMPVPPEVINGYTMIPIRAFSEVLGAKVVFNHESKQIKIWR